jgi:hypothetical protein
MRTVTARRWSSLAIATLLSGGTQIAASNDTDFTGRTAEEAGQLQQMGQLARQPQHVSDKLFILWEYGGALREQALAEEVLRRVQDPQVRERCPQKISSSFSCAVSGRCMPGTLQCSTTTVRPRRIHN